MAGLRAIRSLNHATDDVECFTEDEELMAYFGGCDKNPGHRNLTRMRDLCLESLPKRIRDENVLRTIRTCAKLVVRVIVGCTSPNRPIDDPYRHPAGTAVKRTASGHVRSVSRQSPCSKPDCTPGPGPRASSHGEIDIITNKHVVYDDIEAASTRVELFYDNFLRTDVKIIQGLHVKNSSDFLDVSHVTCVSHDTDLIRLLGKLKNEVTETLADIPPHISASGVCVAISHPHGLPKAVTTGDIIELDEPEYDLTDKIWTWQEDKSATRGGSARTTRNAIPAVNRHESGNHRNQQTHDQSRPRSSMTKRHHANRNQQIDKALLSPTVSGYCHSYSGGTTKRTSHSRSPLPRTRQEDENSTGSDSEPPQSSSPEPEGEDPDGRRLKCRYVSRYTAATCRGSSGGPVFLQFGSSKKQLFCFIHSRFDKTRRMNVSRRKNIF